MHVLIDKRFFSVGNSEPMSNEANSEANKIIAVIIANALLMLVGIVLYMCAGRHCMNVCTKKTSEQTYYEFEESSTISSSQQEL